MPTRTLTFYQNFILQDIKASRQGYRPMTGDSKLCMELKKKGLVAEKEDLFFIIPGATYNYRGNKYTL